METVKHKTMLEIIQETEEYYSDATKRGTSRSGACYYKDNTTGNMCAVGRCMRDNSNNFEFGGFVTAFTNHDDELKPEYKGHSVTFWRDLQMWHDNPANFNEITISEEGLNLINRLKAEYIN